MVFSALADETSNETLTVISAIVGWMYFVCWSVSFYGQLYENFKNQSVHGLSFDFQLLNLTGFAGYTIYNIWCYLNPAMGAKPQIQDVLFAMHAVMITIFTIGQCFYYYDKEDPTQVITPYSKGLVIALVWGFLMILIIEQGLGLYDPTDNKGKTFAFNSIIYLGWTKAIVSFVKYLPQVYLNWKRKSTVGWSIHNIVLDFSGGSLSLIQNLIDSINGQSVISDGPQYALNFVKYAISIIAMFFDIIFVVQHFCLYRNRDEDYNKVEQLINAQSMETQNNTSNVA